MGNPPVAGALFPVPAFEREGCVICMGRVPRITTEPLLDGSRKPVSGGITATVLFDSPLPSAASAPVGSEKTTMLSSTKLNKPTQ